MKKLLTFGLAAMFACAPAFAADTKAADAKAMTPQQEKMKGCNDKASDMKGDERKAFMKTCLSAKPAKPESKMAMCNKKTAGMKSDERAKAQSECMKG
ncbi:MAG: PsiF family protein [Pseudomonadota bacterium]|nr:PsiF family protein [Pseudomonadota bacterium]